MFDNSHDPFQLNNLVNNTGYTQLLKNLDARLTHTLLERKDDFRPGMEYVKQWNYVVDETETIPYITMNFEGKPIIE